jgi:hypothetical protein
MMRQTAHATGFVRLSGLIALLALTGGPARAENYAACAKFDNPLAYNQCLAAQGPVAHGTRAISPPPNSEDGPRGAMAARGREGQSMQISRGRHGRMVLELSVGGAAAGARKGRAAH